MASDEVHVDWIRTGLPIILVIALSSTPVSAQSGPIPDYFPLEVGNEWTYIDVLFPPPDFEPDTLGAGHFSVSGSAVLNDTLYFETEFGRVRKDEFGRVLKYVDGVGTYVLFDFSLDDGALVTHPPEHPEWAEYELTVSKGQSKETHIGLFENTITLNYRHAALIDADYTYVFAPDLGLSESYCCVGDHQMIFSAFVGGAFVTDAIEEPGVPDGFVLHAAYPNPFSLRTTIGYSLSEPSRVEFQVFDVRGALVETLDAGVRPAGDHSAVFDAHGLATGTYFYRLSAGRRAVSKAMVLLR